MCGKLELRYVRLLCGLLLAGLVLAGRVRAQEELVLDAGTAVQLAMERNERLLMAGQDLRRAELRVREAWSGGLPQVNANLGYARNWQRPTLVYETPEGTQRFRIGADNDATGGITLSQALYTGGRVRGAVAAARYTRQQSLEASRLARHEVTEAVETAFYDLLLAGELHTVSSLALARARSNLGQVQALRRAGRVSDYDLLRAEVQVSTFASDSIQSDNAVRLAEMALKDVVGLDLATPIRVAGGFRTHSPLLGQEVAVLQEMGVARRPEVQQLERQLGARRSEVGLARAGLLPTVEASVGGQAQFQSDAELDVVKPEEWRRSWNTALTVSVPVFDGLRSRAQVAQVKADVRQLELERQQTARQVRLEVMQAWLDLREADERLKAQQATVEQAEKGLQVAESRYTGGAGTQLETLDAQLALVQARTERAAAQRDRALAITRLERAVGVLGEATP
ncbi:MAG: TolC family protein [Candidatus Latescibacterota bacterium]